MGSRMPEIKQRLKRLGELGKKMQGHFSRFSGPEGEEMKKEAKKQGTRIGIGAGVSFFGLLVACVTSLYILAVIIFAVNVALNRLWLSSLIVVGGFLLIGGIIIAAGIGIIKPAADELSKSTEGATEDIKETGMEMKAEAEELQAILKEEADEQKQQLNEMVEAAKSAAPVIAPAVAIGFLLLRHIRKRMRRRKERKFIIRVIEQYEAKMARKAGFEEELE